MVAVSLSSLRVLVIDDNPQMRTIVGVVLSAAGVGGVAYAPDGAVGVSQVAAWRPDLCFVDYEMPTLNGLEFISRIRGSVEELRFLPIIMLTGHSDAPRLQSAVNRGVTEFLCKPVSAATILGRLDTVIRRPRPFVKAPNFFGPDRRRRKIAPPGSPMRRTSDRQDAWEI